jgi:hypothetical protein
MFGGGICEEIDLSNETRSALIGHALDCGMERTILAICGDALKSGASMHIYRGCCSNQINARETAK